tara:strand:+ start:2964 stop:3164 length:201 start_codon:yes stop_codon:yes gene_type:complete
MTSRYTNFNKDSSSAEDLSTNQIKTTDVNILLNRVRSDQKKTFKKNVLVSTVLLVLVTSISIFFII